MRVCIFVTIFACVAAIAAGGPVDLATELKCARIEFELPELQNHCATDRLTFFVFVGPALFNRRYCVAGELAVSDPAAGGKITLCNLSKKELSKKNYTLTPEQATAVYQWFQAAGY